VTVNGESQKVETSTYKTQEGSEVTLGTSAPVIGEYSVLNDDGNPCIQLEVDCTITFNYKTKSGERDDNEYLPTNIKAEGDCADEDASTMILTWNGNSMTWYFSKTPGRERWYVQKMELTVDTTSNKFQNINNPGLRRLATKDRAMFFPTPVGKSYSCQDETSVELQGKDIDATVFLRGFKLQPFMYKNEFGPVYECSPGGARAFRDETAPIAVGSTLAIVVLLTVTGYGVYRYFKIKKVQYDTMERTLACVLSLYSVLTQSSFTVEHLQSVILRHN
ncbi:hypothetical protein L9F63_024477, partial [Diploptera punctata]